MTFTQQMIWALPLLLVCTVVNQTIRLKVQDIQNGEYVCSYFLRLALKHAVSSFCLSITNWPSSTKITFPLWKSKLVGYFIVSKLKPKCWLFLFLHQGSPILRPLLLAKLNIYKQVWICEKLWLSADGRKFQWNDSGSFQTTRQCEQSPWTRYFSAYTDSAWTPRPASVLK